MKRASFFVAVLLLAGSPAVAETLVVHPEDLQGWVVSVSGQGDAAFVDGPGTPPIGAGSLWLAGGPSAQDDAAIASTDRHSGTPVAQLTVLSFSANVAAHPDNPNYAGVFAVAVNHDGGGTQDELIYFEPIYNGYAQELNLWQEWDVLNAAVLWSFEQGGPPPGGGFTFDEYLMSHPQAVVLSFLYGVGNWLPSTESSMAFLDRVVFGDGAAVTQYNFDPDIVVFVDGFESGDTAAWSGTAER
ncbi:MAG: hypothetical protein GY719_03960 [bacterium]|nr:hypothetical protein [bacterium]